MLALAAIAGAVSGGLVARFSQTERQPAVTTPSASAIMALPDIPAIIESMRQSVVAINVISTAAFGPRIITQEGTGTGFVLAPNGMIATNAHVVSGARSITVTLPDGSTAAATLVGTDADQDLAVIHVDRTGLVPVSFGQSASLRVGQMVIAVGNALALEGGPTASLGIVSALGRSITTSDGKTYSRLIQTDAAINLGDSGGPLVDAQGRVIGINVAAAAAGSAENVGFAIPIDEAAPVLERLLSRQR